MKVRLSQWWQKKHTCLAILLPFSWIYSVVIKGRRLLYRLGLKKTKHFSVPVIVVGNLTVGGAGKTPLVIALVESLKQQGYRPGVVSRGYGGKGAVYPQKVLLNSDPLQVGDEPVLITRRTGCPVVVDPNRVRAVELLLAEEACDIVLSDDGLQHYALGRNIEIVVVDGERRFGNGWLLPAGPLREPVSRLKTVDIVVCRGGEAREGELKMAVTFGALQPVNAQREGEEGAPTLVPGMTVHAVAGIGHPARFFNQLREQFKVNVMERPFPDHHRFVPGDIDFGADAVVVMTEKDAIKCQAFANERHWYLPIEASCDELVAKLRHHLAEGN